MTAYPCTLCNSTDKLSDFLFFLLYMNKHSRNVATGKQIGRRQREGNEKGRQKNRKRQMESKRPTEREKGGDMETMIIQP